MRRLYLLALLAVLAGCGGTIVSETFSSVGESLPSESASPTPIATPEATPEPTPSESAETTGGSWPDFRSHTITSMGELFDLIVKGEEVINGGDPNADIALSSLGLELALWASDEKQWVREHPPAGCYEDLWASYSEVVDLIDGAAEGALDAMDDFGPAASRFQLLVGEANDVIGESSALIEDVDC